MYRSIFSIAILLLIASSAVVSAESSFDIISFDDRDTNGTDVTPVYDTPLTTNKTVTVEVQGATVELSFPAIPNAKAVYSEAAADIPGYEDPSSSGVGNFKGVSFFVTLYTLDSNEVMDGYNFQPPLVFTVASSSIAAGDHIYFFDTIDETWKNAAESCTGSDFMENSVDGSITLNVCHLTQFAVIAPSPASGDGAAVSSGNGNKGWIAAVVIIPVFVVVVIAIVIFLGLRGSRSRGRHQDIELSKPARVSQPVPEVSSSDSESEDEKAKPAVTKLEEKKDASSSSDSDSDSD